MHYLLPTCLLLSCYSAGRNREDITWSVALQTVFVSSGRRFPRCCFSHRRFLVSSPECLHLWGWLTCCSLVGHAFECLSVSTSECLHAFSSYLGFLPQPLNVQQPLPHWGHFLPLGVPWAGFLLRPAESGSLSWKHICPQELGNTENARWCRHSLLSSVFPGASHLQSHL